jgi:hypothetical protein
MASNARHRARPRQAFGLGQRAFTGAGAVFWLVPPDPSAPSLEVAYSGFTGPAAQAFARHGVAHVVGVSALGRGTPVADSAGLVAASLAPEAVQRLPERVQGVSALGGVAEVIQCLLEPVQRYRLACGCFSEPEINA